jgi:hypothetical protein
VTSDDVVRALQVVPWPTRSHAWLREVRNSTGHSRRERYADAVVVSCWPSRGIWVAGLEVKVSRQDWKRELEDPGKSAEIQKYCDYWYVAAPEGVVEVGEVPEAWGLLVVSDKKRGRVERAKEAPRLEREEWGPGFLASLLRNQSQRLEGARRSGHNEGYHEAAEEYDADKMVELKHKLREAVQESRRLERQVKYAKESEESLRAHVGRVEEEMGLARGTLTTRGPYAVKNVGALYRAAQLLAEKRAADLAEDFEDVARALRELP